MKRNHTNVDPDFKCFNIVDDKRNEKKPHYFSKVLKKQEIEVVFANGTKYTGKYVTLIAAKSNPSDAPSKFLYAVTKNVRTKPAKNTIKRRTREVIRAMYSRMLSGYHIAIIAHNPHVTFQMLKEDITKVLSLKLGCVSPVHSPIV